MIPDMYQSALLKHDNTFVLIQYWWILATFYNTQTHTHIHTYIYMYTHIKIHIVFVCSGYVWIDAPGPTCPFLCSILKRRGSSDSSCFHHKAIPTCGYPKDKWKLARRIPRLSTAYICLYTHMYGCIISIYLCIWQKVNLLTNQTTVLRKLSKPAWQGRNIPCHVDLA